MQKFKRISAFLLCAVMLLSSFASLSVSADEYDFPAGATNVNVTLDGKKVLEGEAVIINSVTSYIHAITTLIIAGFLDSF